MAEAESYKFEYKEIVECLIKKQGIHEGVWSLYVEFGLGAGNFGPNQNEIQPSAIIPLQKIGIRKTTEESNISVDASIVNPKST